MLYQGLKLASRLAIRLLCRDIRINNPAILETKGPVLLAANHPNSFLDSILLDTLFKEPVWALARGDAFKKKWHARLLQSLRIFPVYRTSEGVENLHVNYQTFNTCVALFKQNQIVTIYSEALCVNEWHLRNLKKGTARLAIQAWEAGVPLTVLPVGSITARSEHLEKIFISTLVNQSLPIEFRLQKATATVINILINAYRRN